MNSTMKKIATGFGVGILSGLLGVGGGIFMVPIMVGWFGFTQHVAQATSLAMIIPTAFFSSVVYSLHGSVDLKIASALAAGSMLSAAVGSRVMTRLPAARLKQIFGGMLVLVGIRMVLA
jgi:uncharacterized membrane protein YfcA